MSRKVITEIPFIFRPDAYLSYAAVVGWSQETLHARLYDNSEPISYTKGQVYRFEQEYSLEDTVIFTPVNTEFLAYLTQEERSFQQLKRDIDSLNNLAEYRFNIN